MLLVRLVLMCVCLTGCSSWSFERITPEVTTRVTRTGFITDVSADEVKIEWGSDSAAVSIIGGKSDTVRGTLAPILNKYGVTFRVMHGYSSATTINDIAKETRDQEDPLIALYVGDYDPSGLHMSVVDLPDRLDEYGADVRVVRVALKKLHVSRDLPSFEAGTKAKDPRYRWFVENYGRTCWELDAMDPRQLREEVEMNIRDLMDLEYWERCKRVEKAERESLVEVMQGWKNSISVQASK